MTEPGTALAEALHARVPEPDVDLLTAAVAEDRARDLETAARLRDHLRARGLEQ